MALPKQVAEQLKQIEEIEKQLTAAREPVPTEPAEPVAAQPTDDTPPAEAKPAPVAAPEKPTEPAVSEETWQQKYRTLKGMYDADVPRLHAQVKELTQQVAALQRSLEERATPPEPQKPQSLVTEDDVQAFGADLIEVQRKVAREVAMEFKADIETLKAENAKLREQLTGTDNRVNESSFAQRLHRLVPDFDTVNADPRWIAWLAETDPMLRGPRKIVAQDAFERGDAEGVAHYVTMFKQSIAPAEPPAKPSAEVERQIQPTRSATGTGQPAPSGRLYTNADITRMFKRAADLGAQGRLDDARKLEAEIDAAFMENRVTA